MNISVIIPVFNAEMFVGKSVNSALVQKEVYEIILVEDGSQDSSLQICRSISETNDKVRLYRHQGGTNNGAGQSRNLGIKNALCDYVAFLDADDCYCENRFVETKKVFEADLQLDGVYEVVGVDYYSKVAKKKHLKRMKLTKLHYENAAIPLDHTGVEPGVPSKDLFAELILGKKGWIHLNGMTIKRKSLENFNLLKDLDFAEDTEFILRLAFEKSLSSTNNIRPIAIRNIHDRNRIPYLIKKRNVLWHHIMLYTIDKPIEKKIFRFIVNRYLDNYSKWYYNLPNSIFRKVIKVLNLIITLFKYPIIIKKSIIG